MKKAVFLIMAVLVLAGCSENRIEKNAERTESILLGSGILQLESEDLRLRKETEPKELAAVHKDHVYELDAGESNATVTLRRLHNGDRFIMVRLEGQGEIHGTLSIPEADDYYMVDWSQNMPERGVGEDQTKPPVGMLRFTENHQFVNEVVASHAFTSKTENELYGQGRVSTVQELLKEQNNVKPIKNGIRFTLRSKEKQRTEQWFLVAEKPLFQDTRHLSEWIDFQKEHNEEVNNWFTIDGPMKKQSEVEPATQNSYGYDLDTMIETEAINRYFKNGDRYFYDLTAQSVANLWAYRLARDDTVWKTEVTSVPLKKKYGIVAPYVDLRDNERITRYLLKIGQQWQVPELEDVLISHSDYMLNLINIGNYISTKKGYLPADYYSFSQYRPLLYSSLDQSLNEAGMLLQAYRKTGDERYVEAAQSIRDAMESTGAEWIRPNSDLWNQLNSDGTFTDDGDHSQVLSNLKRYEQTWKELGGRPSPILQKLIESKEQYLNSK